MVANACAMTAGLYLKVGVSTEVPRMSRSVRSPTAVIQASENGACPPSWRHGWKWSLTVALSMPCASAATASSTSSGGANCSADALYPSFIATCSFLLHCIESRDGTSPDCHHRPCAFRLHRPGQLDVGHRARRRHIDRRRLPRQPRGRACLVAPAWL